MPKDSDRLRRGFEVEETGGALSGLLAEEDEFDRRTLWRLGTWAAVSVGAVVIALVTNQSSIGMRREQTAAADLMRQTQQAQLAAKDSQNEARRLASAVETLNSDRDRLYSRVAVLEQELDSVTGAIARQAPTAQPSQAGAGPASASLAGPSQSSPSQTSPSQASSSQASSSQAGASQAALNTASSASSSAPPPSTATAPIASTAPATTASADPPAPAAKPVLAAPVVAPVAATTPAIPEKQDKVGEKQDKQASTSPPSEPSPVVKSAAAQPSGSLMAPKSMMAPPDPAAGKLIEPAAPPKAITAVPLPEIAAINPKVTEEAEPDSTPEALELVARRTEFGVDVGGANSVPGLRALWRGLLKSRTNAVLTTLRPIIVIKENNNGLGMQLRLVAGPINDAAAAAKICASLTVNDRGCTTTVFEGQRLTVGGDEQAKADSRTVSEAKPESDAKVDSAPKGYSHRHYGGRHAPKEEEAPKSEPSTLSLIFGKH
jgi:hypothetical protein